MSVAGCRVTVMGLGHFGGGVAAARWLARQGAVVTVTDLAAAEPLADTLPALADVPIARYHLGEHQAEDFREADLVVVNPAVRPGNRFVQIAAEAGARLTTEIELFLEACPARVIGVTGSNGKSTTAAMTAAILRAAGRRVWLGGNIGVSLLDSLSQMTADDWAVLEISSFQLWRLGPNARLPDVAIVTNCSPNHLDWHGTFEHYQASKQRILTGQRADGLAVLNTHDPEVATWAHLVRGRLLPLVPLAELPPLPIPGEHNRANAACAATAALATGCRPEAVQAGLASFSPLPQRMEWVAVVDGRRFYNDSSATTPESTIAALESLAGPIWLLAGGGDKGADFQPLASAIARCAQGAAFFGKVRDRLRQLTAAAGMETACTALETMPEAFWWCWANSQPGDAIVLSPACSSHDQFQNFRQRGTTFVDLVRQAAERQKQVAQPY
jgi:UDP-N-acetylmuramoylalanine--D-glutamate ligase